MSTFIAQVCDRLDPKHTKTKKVTIEAKSQEEAVRQLGMNYFLTSIKLVSQEKKPPIQPSVLVNCPDCKNQLSRSAKACPNCGCKICSQSESAQAVCQLIALICSIGGGVLMFVGLNDTSGNKESFIFSGICFLIVGIISKRSCGGKTYH